MNILFLNLDGVLVPHVKVKEINQEYPTFINGGVKEDLVYNLNRICKRYKLFIVLTSSYRYKYSIEQMRKMFKENNIKAPLIGYITYEHMRTKSMQITEWIEENADDIDKYLIFDDEIKAGEDHEEQFKKLDKYEGLDLNAYYEIIQKFDAEFLKQ